MLGYLLQAGRGWEGGMVVEQETGGRVECVYQDVFEEKFFFHNLKAKFAQQLKHNFHPHSRFDQLNYVGRQV
jgi:hypothetical protein